MIKILSIKINDYENFDYVFDALDKCGYDNNFSFTIKDNDIVIIKVDKIVDSELQKLKIIEALDNCGYENDFSFELMN